MKKKFNLLVTLLLLIIVASGCDKENEPEQTDPAPDYELFDFKDFTEENYNTLKQEKQLIIQSNEEYKNYFGKDCRYDLTEKTLIIGYVLGSGVTEVDQCISISNFLCIYIINLSVSLNLHVSNIYYGAVINKMPAQNIKILIYPEGVIIKSHRL